MTLVPAYHTLTDPKDEVYHIYDDCPSGEVVIKNGNDHPGTNNWDLCRHCKKKRDTGEF
jgi:hypothetical protein